jgi:hypothetical protein
MEDPRCRCSGDIACWSVHRELDLELLAFVGQHHTLVYLRDCPQSERLDYAPEPCPDHYGSLLGGSRAEQFNKRTWLRNRQDARNQG